MATIFDIFKIVYSSKPAKVDEEGSLCNLIEAEQHNLLFKTLMIDLLLVEHDQCHY